MTAADDFLASVRDPNVKEIIAKESLEYDPKRSANLGAERAALGEMVELGHSVFHKVCHTHRTQITVYTQGLPHIEHRL